MRKTWLILVLIIIFLIFLFLGFSNKNIIGRLLSFDSGNLTCVDYDRDGYNITAGCGIVDCNDTYILVNPGITEICNNMDENCNNIKDENCFSCQCADLNYDKVIDVRDFLVFRQYLFANNNCSMLNNWCDRVDMNKDGKVDYSDIYCLQEGFLDKYSALTLCNCSEGEKRRCKIYINESCGFGTSFCENKEFGECKPIPMPFENEFICDGKDDNCNGEIDEGLLNKCYDYNNCNVYYSCLQCPAPPLEICDDNLDNDCDDKTDEKDCTNWKKMNNGGSIHAGDGSYDNIESISINNSLIYFFKSKTSDRFAGRLTEEGKWELWTEKGWDSSDNAIAKPLSLSEYIFKIKRMFGYNNGIFMLANTWTRSGAQYLDVHGAVLNFIFDGNNWLKWYSRKAYSKYAGTGIIHSWTGVDYDFAFNESYSGIFIGTYGSWGVYGRLTAARFNKDDRVSNWKLWDGSDWTNLDNTYYYNFTPVPNPLANLTNTNYSLYSPSISYIGDNGYIITFLYKDNIIGALLYKDEKPYIWKWWNSSGWQEGGDYNYSRIAPLNASWAGFSFRIIGKKNEAHLFTLNAKDNALYDIFYDRITGDWTTKKIADNVKHFSAEKNKEEIWIAYVDYYNQVILIKESENWQIPLKVYKGKIIEGLSINFFQDIPIIFILENRNLYAVSDASLSFWKNEKNVKREERNYSAYLNESKIQLVNSWPDNTKGIDYGAATSGALAIDSEERIYSPHIAFAGVIIFNLSNFNQSNFWGGFWDYFYFPSSVAIDNIREKVYVADFLTTGGAGGVASGRVQIFDKNLSNTTLWEKDGSEKEGLPIPPEVFPKRVVGSFVFPVDLAIDEKNGFLYVSDPMRNKIQKFDIKNLENELPKKIGDLGNEGKKKGEFSFPQGIDTDSEGNLYVVDALNYRIQKFDKDGKFILEFGSLGYGDSEFIYPYAISVDPSYNLVYVTDAFKKEIQIFTKSGRFLYRFGKWNYGSFNEIGGIVADGKGNLFVGSDDKIIKFKVNLVKPQECDDENNLTFDFYNKSSGKCQYILIVYDNDKDGVPDEFDRCSDTRLRKEKVNKFGCPKPKADNFDIVSDMEYAENLSEIENFEIGVGKIGKIYFYKISLIRMIDNEFESLDLDKNINISRNRIEVNSTALPELNVSSIITMYNLNLSIPVILKDGNNCSECSIILWDNSSKIIQFSVSHFTTYEIVEGILSEQEVVNIISGGGSGSGGGGGASPIQPVRCIENWSCGGWQECRDNIQMRACEDRNKCKTEISKPETTRACEQETEEEQEKQKASKSLIRIFIEDRLITIPLIILIVLICVLLAHLILKKYRNKAISYL